MNEDFVMVKGCVVGKVKRVLTLRKVRKCYGYTVNSENANVQ